MWFVKTLYYKTQHILLKNVTAIFLQNVTKGYFKMRQVFHYSSFITKCDSYYKMGHLIQNSTIQTPLNVTNLEYKQEIISRE